MFILLLILISVSAFLIGLGLGRVVSFPTKSRISIQAIEDEEYKNFLNYDGNIQ